MKTTDRPNILKSLTILFWCTLGIQTLHAHSDSSADSLKTIYVNESLHDSIRFNAIKDSYELTSSLDNSLELTEYHYQLAEAKTSSKEIFQALRKKGSLNLRMSDLGSASVTFNSMLELSRNMQDSSLWALSVGDLGIVHGRLGEYLPAVRCFSQALDYYQQTNDRKGEGRMINNLGGVYQIIGDYDLALEYYKNSLVLIEEDGPRTRNAAIAHLNIGGVSLKNDDLKGAINSYEQAENICLEINNRAMLPDVHRSLGKAYKKKEDLESAEFHAKTSIRLNQELGLEKDVIMDHLLLAEITSKSSVDEALELVQIITPVIPEISNKQFKIDYYNLLYECYKSINQTGKALKMYELSVLYQDSLQLQSGDLAVIREAIKKDFEIQIYQNQLKNEKAQYDLKLKEQRKTFFIIGFSALLIFMILYRVRRMIKENAAIRADLLDEIEELKKEDKPSLMGSLKSFSLNKIKVEKSIGRELNETDWKVLNILVENPVVQNKEIAEKAFKSVDGIGSSLRRMYGYFEIKDTKYKKISLLMKVIKISNSQ